MFLYTLGKNVHILPELSIIGQNTPLTFILVNLLLKAHFFKAMKTNASSLLLSAYDQTLRVYQNKGLSNDRCCGLPNTFPTHYQTFEPRINIFL